MSQKMILTFSELVLRKSQALNFLLLPSPRGKNFGTGLQCGRNQNLYLLPAELVAGNFLFWSLDLFVATVYCSERSRWRIFSLSSFSSSSPLVPTRRRAKFEMFSQIQVFLFKSAKTTFRGERFSRTKRWLLASLVGSDHHCLSPPGLLGNRY